MATQKTPDNILSTIVTLAEEFIVDLQEVDNRIISIEEIQRQYGDWIGEVRRQYVTLTNTEVPPIDLREWSDEILNLAGWILDISLLVTGSKDNGRMTDREMWLIKNSRRHYHESLEKLKELEQKQEW